MSSICESRSSSNPTSALLQDMIKEKRAETQRVNRAHEAGGRALHRGRPDTDGRDVQSSPLTTASARGRPGGPTRRSSGMAAKAPPAPKDMCLREMQEHLSKINKQNFDLKLEIFHRRQRNEVLEAKVEKLEVLEVENEDLRVANDDLVLRVQKRDSEISMREAAIEEAVGMICQLEARIEELEQDLRNDSRRIETPDPSQQPQEFQQSQNTASTKLPLPQIDHGSDDDGHLLPYLRQETPANVGTLTRALSKSPLQRPSFLRDNKSSTSALRNLYSSGNPSFASFPRPSSVFSDEDYDEDMDRQMLNSPRLSILSESGFSSIYGHLHEKMAIPQREAGTSTTSSSSKGNNRSAQRIAQCEARISNWVEESQQLERPTTPVRRSPKTPGNDHFSSISEVLEEVPDTNRAKGSLGLSPRSPTSTVDSGHKRQVKRFQGERSPTKSLRKSARAHDQLSSKAGSVLGRSHLPPTPDTMSTATIGGSSSTQSIITEKSIADGSLVPTNGYAALIQSERPQSANSKFAYQFSSAADQENGFETSDEELDSTQVERSEMGLSEAPSFIGGSIKAAQFFGNDELVRPSLSTHVTKTMFNGEGYSPKPLSRTFSYPSPTGTSRHFPNQLSSSSKRSSGVRSEKTVTSPPRSSPAQPRSPGSSQLASTVPYGAVVKTERGSKHYRSSSMRFRLPRLSSATASGNQSVTSRIFRRSNSQATNTPPTSQDISLPRPASGHKRPSLPRPSSLYGQPFPSSPLKSMLPQGMLTDAHI
ncbi:MAG: hypothetical protein Q9163_003082 [Psora crenata]